MFLICLHFVNNVKFFKIKQFISLIIFFGNFNDKISNFLNCLHHVELYLLNVKIGKLLIWYNLI